MKRDTDILNKINIVGNDLKHSLSMFYCKFKIISIPTIAAAGLGRIPLLFTNDFLSLPASNLKILFENVIKHIN